MYKYTVEKQDISFIWVKRLSVIILACVVALCWLG